MLLEDLLARLDSAAPKPIPVDIPGLGLLHVLPLTVADMNAAEVELAAAADKPTTIALGAARLLCDENGVRYGTSEALVSRLRALKWDHMQAILGAAQGSAGAGNG